MAYLVEKYTLLKKQVPTINNKTIISGDEFGGIKLTYSVRLLTIKQVNIFGRTFNYVAHRSKPKLAIFLRPFKKVWSGHRLPPAQWGKKSHPLTRIWVKISSDYSDFNKDYVRLIAIKTYTNYKIIRLLNDIPTTFKSNIGMF